MALCIRGDKTGEWWVTNWQTKRYIPNIEEHNNMAWHTRANGGIYATAADGGPIVLPQAIVDDLPVVKP